MTSACTKDKWFDQKSNLSQVVPARVQDFQAMLDNILMDWNSPYLAEIGCDDHYILDAQFTMLSTNEQDAYTWSHANPYKSVIDWGGGNDGTYTRVYYANLTLDGLKTATGAGTADYNNVMGEALFYRAKNFFDILQEYAPVYDSAKAATDLGIVLRLQSDITITSARSTVKDSYNQVIADASAAIPLLPVTPLYKTRPSKPAAYALLARLYLSVSDYTDAGKYADSCLQLYNTIVDFNTLNYTASYPLVNYNNNIIFHCSQNVGNGPVSYNAKVDSLLFKLYDTTDLRRKLFFTVNSDQTVIVKQTNFYNVCFSGLTIEEIYMIKAECSARAGNVADAMTYLNTLLRKRYVTGTYVDKTAASADEALRIVLMERRKELLMHGTRWSDLRRLNKDPRFAKTITRVVKGQAYTLQPNSLQYTLPIPDDVMLQVPGLQQNPGW
jgi:tetratricopeptide (TPR) repeat protein